MPTVRLVNPKRSRVRRANAKRLRWARNGRFQKRKRGRNPAAGGGELLLMNPKRRRVRHRNRAHHRKYRRRRRQNPMSYAVARPVRRRRRSYANPVHHRRRRHHNPLGMSGRDIVATSAWAIAGGVATRAIPQMFLKDGNTGIMGYGANALTAGILAYGADRFFGGNAGKGVLLGGMVMLGGRIIADLFGKTLVSFGDVFGTTGTSGLGAHGDPSFDLGIYVPNEFVVPTWSDGVLQRQDYPFLEPSSALPAASSSVRAQMMPSPAVVPMPKTGVSGLGFASTGRLKSRFAA
jgi:TM2 domain-containing membrane protein YozV